MDSLNLNVKELMPFVPSGGNYPKALEFFQDLGFKVDWKSDELALLRAGTFRFFLQKFDDRNFQDNYMVNMDVENLDDWWTWISSRKLTEKYPGVRLKEPTVYPWGKREINIVDPAGVCWHIGCPA